MGRLIDLNLSEQEVGKSSHTTWNLVVGRSIHFRISSIPGATPPASIKQALNALELLLSLLT